MKEFHIWLTAKLDLLKQSGADPFQDDSAHLRALLSASYMKSSDPELTRCVQKQLDDIRDNPTEEYTWKQLMSRVSRKSEPLLLDLEREALGSAKKTEDPILKQKTLS